MATPPNELGQFLRERRREKGLTLAQVGEQIGFSLGYISRVELGQVTEGPSLDCLHKLAAVLDLPVRALVERRDRDRSAPADGEREAGLPPAVGQAEMRGESVQGLERELLAHFRALDERGRLFLLAQAQVTRRALGSTKAVRGLLPERLLPEIADEELRRLAGEQARLYRRMAERLRALSRLPEAEARYEQARSAFESLGDGPEEAATLYRLATLLIELEADSSEPVQDRLFLLHRAADLLSRAERTFRAHWQRLDVAHMDRLGRTMDQAGRVAELLGEREADAHPGLTDEERRQLRFLYGRREREKRLAAVAYYREWVDRLGAEEVAATVDERVESLAYTFQRWGAVLGDLARDRWSSEEERENRFRESIDRLATAIRLRREQVRAAWAELPGSEHAGGRGGRETERPHAHLLVIERLANAHQEMGYQYQTWAREPDPEKFRRALWHYELARRWNRLLPEGFAPRQMTYLESLREGLQQEELLPGEQQAAIEREITRRLGDAADIGRLLASEAAVP